jgi:ferredoxin--NADP+ reductase
VVYPEEAALDPLSQQYVENANDRSIKRNIEILTDYARRPAGDKPRKIVMRFLVSPVEVIGDERVEAVKIVKNKLVQKGDGSLRPVPTEETEILPIGLIFRSVGYHGVPLPGVPFREDWGIIPNEEGRVVNAETNEPVVGEYVVGWIKRGPSGIIGTNKPDSQATANALLEDVAAGKALNPSHPARAELEALLAARHVQYVTFEDWLLLDALEQERGQAIGRSRLKFTDIGEMLEAIAERKRSAVAQ